MAGMVERSHYWLSNLKPRAERYEREHRETIAQLPGREQ